jgi:glutaminyl-peptide cyclotransferase
MRKAIIFLSLPLYLLSCDSEETLPEPIKIHKDPVKDVPKLVTPTFNADSCYQFVEDQLAFGPRIPNSPEHDLCAKYLIAVLDSFGAEVTVQKGNVTAYTQETLAIQNIIGRFYPKRPDRMMICAHWDTRHMSDRDKVNPTGKFDGANDGASGVAVILEIARQLMLKDPEIGVDLILFDAEDYGSSEVNNGMMQLSQMNDSWCLGSQYWAKNPPVNGQKPKFGILLDMVGAANATFPKEGYSLKYANPIVQAVWNKGQKLGYGSYFQNVAIGGITDDHKYINELAGIPTIDIIHYNRNKSDFGSFHHTHQDNIDIIDKKTLKVVGHTCLEIIYQGL